MSVFNPKKSPNKEKFQNGGSFRKARDPRVKRVHEAPTTEPFKLAVSSCSTQEMPRVTSGKRIYQSMRNLIARSTITRHDDLPSVEAFVLERRGIGL